MDNKLFGVIAVFAILKGGNGDLGYWFNIRRLFISDNHYKQGLFQQPLWPFNYRDPFNYRTPLIILKPVGGWFLSFFY
jgi:hypothetical protein